MCSNGCRTRSSDPSVRLSARPVWGRYTWSACRRSPEAPRSSAWMINGVALMRFITSAVRWGIPGSAALLGPMPMPVAPSATGSTSISVSNCPTVWPVCSRLHSRRVGSVCRTITAARLSATGSAAVRDMSGWRLVATFSARGIGVDCVLTSTSVRVTGWRMAWSACGPWLRSVVGSVCPMSMWGGRQRTASAARLATSGRRSVSVFFAARGACIASGRPGGVASACRRMGCRGYTRRLAAKGASACRRNTTEWLVAMSFAASRDTNGRHTVGRSCAVRGVRSVRTSGAVWALTRHGRWRGSEVGSACRSTT